MEQDPAEKETVQWGKVADKARAEAEKVEVAWGVPLRRAMSAPACARNAGIVHRMSVECPVSSANVLSVEPTWQGNNKQPLWQGTTRYMKQPSGEAGVVRVGEIAELFDAAEVLDSKRLPVAPRLAIVTSAGGPGIMATDALIHLGGNWRNSQRKRLRS